MDHEFTIDNEHFRIVRSTGDDQVWMLFGCQDDDRRGWRLLRDYPASISEDDIVDRVMEDLS